MKKILFILCALIGTFQGAMAARVATAEVEGINVRAVAPQLRDGETLSWAIVSPEGKATPLTPGRFNLSVPCLQRKQATVQIFDLADLTAALQMPNASLPTPLYEVALGPKAKSCFLIFERYRFLGQEKWKPRLVPDEAEQFPGNSRLLINLSSASLRGTLDEQPFQVGAKETALLRSPNEPGKLARRTVQVYERTQTGERLIVSARWSFSEQTRGLAIFFEDPTTGRLRHFGFPDAVPQAPKEAKR